MTEAKENYNLFAFNNFIISSTMVILSVLVTRLKNPLLQCICFKSSKELDLEVEISELKKELRAVNCRDDFVKHSKMSRRLAALEKELSIESDNRRGSHSWQIFVITVFCEIFGVLILLATVIIYMKDPIVVMPTQWFFPFNVILSWPTGVDGSISTLIWIVLLRLLLHMLK